jgi:hypothetical protein
MYKSPPSSPSYCGGGRVQPFLATSGNRTVASILGHHSADGSGDDDSSSDDDKDVDDDDDDDDEPGVVLSPMRSPSSLVSTLLLRR